MSGNEKDDIAEKASTHGESLSPSKSDTPLSSSPRGNNGGGPSTKRYSKKKHRKEYGSFMKSKGATPFLMSTYADGSLHGPGGMLLANSVQEFQRKLSRSISQGPSRRKSGSFQGARGGDVMIDRGRYRDDRRHDRKTRRDKYRRQSRSRSYSRSRERSRSPRRSQRERRPTKKLSPSDHKGGKRSHS